MKKGDYYTIRNFTPSGVPIVEGTAKLIRCIDSLPDDPDMERWAVRFTGDKVGTAERLVQAEDRLEPTPPART